MLRPRISQFGGWHNTRRPVGCWTVCCNEASNAESEKQAGSISVKHLPQISAQTADSRADRRTEWNTVRAELRNECSKRGRSSRNRGDIFLPEDREGVTCLRHISRCTPTQLGSAWRRWPGLTPALAKAAAPPHQTGVQRSGDAGDLPPVTQPNRRRRHSDPPRNLARRLVGRPLKTRSR